MNTFDTRIRNHPVLLVMAASAALKNSLASCLNINVSRIKATSTITDRKVTWG
jgi:hypothetical protein